jgi:branched-chain amino acid transport system ATP-binding protein
MSQDLLRVSDLCKSFGGVHVTTKVSFGVAAGEIHAIIGPNGAGKTTLIDQISGRVGSDAGRIFLEGRDITTLPMRARARLGLSRCFQVSSVLPTFTAMQNVAMAVLAGFGEWPSFVRNPDEDPRIVEPALEALAKVGLKGRENVEARALAHGEKRQLELAIAMATKPRLILLDEPLSGTGPDEARHLIGFLATLRGRTAMVLVEHDMEAVFALADRVSVLVYGKLIASGAPADVRSNPDVRAAYLGEAQ